MPNKRVRDGRTFGGAVVAVNFIANLRETLAGVFVVGACTFGVGW